MLAPPLGRAAGEYGRAAPTAQSSPSFARIGSSSSFSCGERDPSWATRLCAFSILAALPFQLGFLLHPDPIVALAVYIPGALVGGMWAPPSYAALTQALGAESVRFALAIPLALNVVDAICHARASRSYARELAAPG